MSRYHRILQIPPNASKSEIKKAYFKLAKKYHPDLNDSEKAEEEFIKINEAYEFLTNPKFKRRFTRVAPKTYSQKRRTVKKDKTKREKAQKKAREYARMKHDAFKKAKIKRQKRRDWRILAVIVIFLFLLISYAPSIIFSIETVNEGFANFLIGILVIVGFAASIALIFFIGMVSTPYD